MSDRPEPNRPLDAAAEIERRIRWRALPTIAFMGLMALFLGAALWPMLFPPPHLAGLPDDPDAFAAAQALRGRVSFPSSGLRFESAVTGPLAPGVRAMLDEEPRLAQAEQLVRGARARLRRDPRWSVACGALDLARHRYPDAVRHYRRGLSRSANYPEARLGLGVALALEADLSRHPLAQRRLQLMAIAQFAAVTPRDAEYEEALFNRAVLLDRVGRLSEAGRLARRYIARDSVTTWSETMRNIVRRAT